MKKLTLLFLVIVTGIMLSGCSLAPSKNGKAKTPQFTFSQSIWKSTDGGKTWQVKNKGEGKAHTTNIEVLSLAINPQNSQNIFVGLRHGGILETDNGGDTWKFMNFKSDKVYGLALSSSNGKTILYASGVWNKRGKIFKTSDDGKQWQEVYTTPAEGPLIISLTIDPKKSNIIYATTSNNEAIKSVDGGISWKNIYEANAPILKIAVDYYNSNLIYFITDTGQIFRSTNGGINFKSITQKINQNGINFSEKSFNVLKTSLSRSGWVYLAGNNGIILSKDKGENWKKIPTLDNSNEFPVDALAVNPKNYRELVYGASQTVYNSSDNGVHWTTFQFDTKMKTRSLIYDPTNPNIVYAGFTK